MKLLFLINSLSGGGAEKVLIDIIKNLDREKYDITVCTIFNEGIYREEIPQHIKYRSVIKKPNGIKYSLFWRMLKYLPRKWTYRLFIGGGYDVEVAFLEGLSTLLLSGSTCKKKIAWMHTDIIENDFISPYFRSDADHISVYKSYNKIVFVSTLSLNQFVKRFGDFGEKQVIYNFVDKKAIIEKASEGISLQKVKNENLPVVCSVGRLIPIKGYMRLLSVHKRLIDEGINHNLWLLGTGDEESNLSEYIKENNLSDTVKLWGFQKNPYPYINKSDIYVCSSFAEGYPLSVAEALVLEKPIVATNCTGPSEIIGDSVYGLLVENDEEGIYTGLKSLLLSPEKYAQVKQKAAIGAGNLSPERFMKKIEEVLGC